MRFSTLSLLCVVGSAFAAPTAPQDTQDTKEIERVLGTVTQGLLKLNDGFATRYRPQRGDVNGAKQYVENLLRLDAQVVEAISRGEQDIKRMQGAWFYEGVNLAAPLLNLQNGVTAVVEGWMEIKPIVDQAQKKREVIDALIRDERAAAWLADAIVSKVPAGSFFGTWGKTTFTSIIERGVSLYRNSR
jgi:hypothetical protein